MGLLEKIIGEPVAWACTAPPAGSNLRTIAPAASRQALEAPSVTPTWANAVACPNCGCAAFWRDVYGGGPHCRICKPSAPSLIKNFAWIVLEGGQSVWTDQPRPLEPGSEASDDEQARSITIEHEGRAWTVTAPAIAELRRRGLVDVLRVADETGHYQPPRGFGPVGDMLFDEWWGLLEPTPPPAFLPKKQPAAVLLPPVVRQAAIF